MTKLFRANDAVFTFYFRSSPASSSSSSFFDECPEEVFDNLPTAMVDPAAELCDELALAVADADVTTLTIPPIKLLRKLDESDPILFYNSKPKEKT